MKILLLGFAKIAYMPYMHLYTDLIKDEDCELVYWDRDGKPDIKPPACVKKAYCFRSYLEEQMPFKNKLFHFWKYRRFVKQILKKNQYDFIFVLHTTQGLTLLDILCRKYRNKYSLDFRDVSYEYIPLYRKLVGILARNARCTFVSSDAFRKFLPEKLPIYTVHNYLVDSLDHRNVRTISPRNLQTIRISFWGLVRQLGVNKKLMDVLGNDLRFELHYYGRMQQAGRDMESYAKNKGYQNVYFHGSYLPTDRYDFASQTDLIHNLYDTGYTMGNAMGNKYYDGLIFKLPQICTAGSFMGERVKREGVGLTVDLDEPDLADKLWAYYKGLDWQKFEENCDTELKRVQEEQGRVQKIIRDILSKK